MFQIYTHLIKASGGVQPHDTWRKAKSTQGRVALLGGSTEPPATGCSLSGMLLPPQTWVPSQLSHPLGLGARTCSSVDGHQGSDEAPRLSWAAGLGSEGHRRVPTPEALNRRMAPVSAASHCRHRCCPRGDVTTPSGKLPARERQCPSSDTRCLLMPAAQAPTTAGLLLGLLGAGHVAGDWQATCCVLLQVHFFYSSQ